MPRRLIRSSSSLLSVAALVVLAGCASQTHLEPAPSAQESPSVYGAAVNSVDGVRILAEPNAWVGRAAVTGKVTPIRVVVENHSDHAVQIRYADFALNGSKGRRYAALPPYGVEGTVTQPRVIDSFTPVAQPAFTYTGFYVAPYLGTAYPGLDPYDRPFYYDPFYNSYYYTLWQKTQLPTREMVNEVLPEGVLEKGGRIAGFLYFQHVEPESPRVVFRADLVDAGTGDAFGTVTIPFTVEGGS